jgi:hypothetical protein
MNNALAKILVARAAVKEAADALRTLEYNALHGLEDMPEADQWAMYAALGDKVVYKWLRGDSPIKASIEAVRACKRAGRAGYDMVAEIDRQG